MITSPLDIIPIAILISFSGISLAVFIAYTSKLLHHEMTKFEIRCSLIFIAIVELIILYVSLKSL